MCFVFTFHSLHGIMNDTGGNMQNKEVTQRSTVSAHDISTGCFIFVIVLRSTPALICPVSTLQTKQGKQSGINKSNKSPTAYSKTLH